MRQRIEFCASYAVCDVYFPGALQRQPITAKSTMSRDLSKILQLNTDTSEKQDSFYTGR